MNSFFSIDFSVFGRRSEFSKLISLRLVENVCYVCCQFSLHYLKTSWLSVRQDPLKRICSKGFFESLQLTGTKKYENFKHSRQMHLSPYRCLLFYIDFFHSSDRKPWEKYRIYLFYSTLFYLQNF